jgi:RimJ/RimL family protein N-acetyltransferase
MPELHRLDSGEEVLIRPIRPSDKAILAAGLARLSPESARARFLTAKPRFTSEELRYLTEVDGVMHHALVAVRADDPSCLAAVGRYVRLAEDPATAEIAIVVADALQGQGLGRHIGTRLTEHAREHAVQRFVALMLSDNAPAHRLFAAISQQLRTERDQPGVDRLLVSLAA